MTRLRKERSAELAALLTPNKGRRTSRVDMHMSRPEMQSCNKGGRATNEKAKQKDNRTLTLFAPVGGIPGEIACIPHVYQLGVIDLQRRAETFRSYGNGNSSHPYLKHVERKATRVRTRV